MVYFMGYGLFVGYGQAADTQELCKINCEKIVKINCEKKKIVKNKMAGKKIEKKKCEKQNG